MQIRARQVEQGALRILKTVVLGIDRRLVNETPVDTGQARSNWLASVNVPRFDTGPILQPAAALALVRAGLSAVRNGDTVYLSNNLPYIVALNRGKSAQAPPHYINNIVRDAKSAIQGARILGTSKRIRVI